MLKKGGCNRISYMSTWTINQLICFIWLNEVLLLLYRVYIHSENVSFSFTDRGVIDDTDRELNGKARLRDIIDKHLSEL